jgi:hypothetical protein
MLFPVKTSGVYGENEEILIVTRFSAPVLVRGNPVLALKTGTDRSSLASYMANVTGYNDLLIEFSNTDVIFRYLIQQGDDISDLSHNGTTAIQTGNDFGEILQYSQTLSHSADLTLREPNDFIPMNGLIERQWKLRFPMKIEFLFKDLLHNAPSTLSAKVDHNGIQATLFSQCCQQPGRRYSYFGYSSSVYTSGSVTTPFAQDSSLDPITNKNVNVALVGEDLFFSDTEAANIAMNGLASQSSTILPANLAIDGGYSPLVGDKSVSETVQEDNPWWMLTLPLTNRMIQSILIYERLPEIWITPVISFTIKGLDRYPKGYYRLSFSNIDTSDASISVTTNYIPMRAEAKEIQFAITDIQTLGIVSVSKVIYLYVIMMEMVVDKVLNMV